MMFNQSNRNNTGHHKKKPDRQTAASVILFQVVTQFDGCHINTNQDTEDIHTCFVYEPNPATDSLNEKRSCQPNPMPCVIGVNFFI